MSTNGTIPIVLNGETHTAPVGLSITGLLESLEVDGERVAVELNRQIVKRAEWPATVLHSGAKIEIVQFVGGG